jgi:hypothetical protein
VTLVDFPLLRALALALQPLLALATAGSLLACPIDKIAQATREPLGTYEKTEVDVLEYRSTDGGVWHIYRKRDGALHSVVRTDFGETGQLQTRISFVDKHTFGIVVTTLRYDAPIYLKDQVQVVERVSTEYLLCDKSNVVYVPASPQDESSALAAIRKAKEERAMLFGAKEIAPYLKDIR